MRKKPLLYEAACVFSIVGSTIGFVTMFIATFFFNAVIKQISSVTNYTATEKLSPVYFAALGSAFCISLIGAVKLYRMQRTGFYFYFAAQLFVMFLPVFFLGKNSFSVTNAIFTSLFSGVYLYYFRLTK